jgi:hypothetical protein
MFRPYRGGRFAESAHRKSWKPPSDEVLAIGKQFASVAASLDIFKFPVTVAIAHALTTQTHIDLKPLSRPRLILSFGQLLATSAIWGHIQSESITNSMMTDGGGIRSFSSLLVLQAIMNKMNKISNDRKEPCQW